MAKVITVLKSGGEYKPEHVYRLGDQVLKHNPSYDFICISDLDLDCNSKKLSHNWHGWWSKIELFDLNWWIINDNIIYLDLDTDVIGSLDSVIRDDFTMLSDFYKPNEPASGVMAWHSKNTPTEVYDEFVKSPQQHMARYKTSARWGDQAFIRDHAKNINRFESGIIASYKVHCTKTIPDWAKVVAYHGKPKPWEI